MKMHKCNLVISFVVTIFWCSSFTVAQSPCTTPNRQPGVCVRITDCPPIIDILNKFRNKPIPPQLSLAIQSLKCGIENNSPKVCCQGLKATATETPPTPATDPTLVDKIQPTDYLNHKNAAKLPLRTCGPILNSKISGGNKTEIFQYPWAALLQYNTGSGLQFRCGGSLISSRFILTAAHCVVGRDVDLVSVRLGEHTISTEVDCQKFGDEEVCAGPVQDIPVDRIFSHPQYNTPKFAHDVAVVRLSRDAALSDQVQAVCLPITLQLQNAPLKIITAMGWGTTELKTASDELLQININVIKNEDCQKTFKRSILISERQFCAGDQKGVDTCKGDSGGPLVYPGFLRQTQYIQYGIVSAGSSCGSDTSSFPGVYVRVTAYMKWILDQLN